MATHDRLMIIVADRVLVRQRLEQRHVALLHVEESHCLQGIMRRAAERCRKGGRYGGLQIMQATRWVVARYMFLVDRAAVGSWATPKTIGIVAVAVLAASAASVLLGVAITATRRCTKSVTTAGKRS